ncbi:MAG: hypothetical protein WC861_03710 [Candidatus Micrarchaeia archaeon]
MGNIARPLAFIMLAAAILLSPGCAQVGAPARNETASSARFILPASDVSYYARYTVEEGGPATKEIWRAKGMMRIDLSSQGMRALSFFFVDSHAYSCSYASSKPACYDVSGALSQGDAQRLVPSENDAKGGTRLESVKIGSANGNCYGVPIGMMGMRKLCFAPQGVVAYDSYNVSKALLHTEYLTDIEYYEDGLGPDASVFALPATPIPAPAVPEPAAPDFEE